MLIMTLWNYIIIPLYVPTPDGTDKVSKHIEDSTEILNEFGNEGWEAVNMFPKANDWTMVILKRGVSPERLDCRSPTREIKSRG